MRRVSVLAILFLSSLLAGCLVDGVKRESTSAKPDSSDPQSFYISGRFIKGVLDGAVVQVYPYVNGILLDTTIAEVRTDINGHYQAKIPREYIGKSAVIRASSANRIRCDLVDGCGNDDFGMWSTYENETLILSVAVPELAENGVYNGSALTHIAVASVNSDYSSVLPADNAVADIAIKTLIQKSNSKVVSAFGLVGDLPRLNIFDITIPADYENATALEMRYSVMNSAAVASASKVFELPDPQDALRRLTEQFVELGLSGKSMSASQEVTQVDLLEELAKTFQYLQTSTNRDYTIEISETLTLRNLFLHDAAGEYSRGTSSESLNLTSVERAKKMLSSVREFAFSMDLRKLAQFSNLATFTSGEVADALEGFGIVLDTAEILKEEKTGRILDALFAVSKSAIEVLMLYYDNQPIPEVVHGVRVGHTGSAKLHSFEVRDAVNVCENGESRSDCDVPVDLVLTIAVSDVRGNKGASVIVLENLEITLAGTVGDANYRFFFPGTETSFRARQLYWQDRVESVEGKTLWEIDQLDAGLPFDVFSEEGDISSSMHGIIAASADKLGITLHDQVSVISEHGQTVESSVTSLLGLFSLKNLSVDASMSIDLNSEDQFFAAFNIHQGSPAFEGSAVYRSAYRRVCNGTVCRLYDEISDIQGETNENFVRLSASAAYKANLKGIKTPVLIQITGLRESPSINKVSNLKVNYPGHALTLNGRFSNGGGISSLDATNLDGMHLYFDLVNGKRTGAVETPAKEKVADITDMGQWVKIRYLNGDFESL